MLKQNCLVCKILGVIVIVGALNWGSIAVLNVNFVEQVLGVGTTVTRGVYGLVGLAGVILLLSCFGLCPACKK